MTIRVKSSELQQNFGQAIEQAQMEGDIIVERYGSPRVAIVEYRRYERLVQAEQELLRLRLQAASAAASARAANLNDSQVEALIEDARRRVCEETRGS